MSRQRPQLGTPISMDGPWLAAILDVLFDLHDLLDARLPEQSSRPVSEPAPSGKPAKAVPVSEPAPDRSPAETVPVSEPDPDDEPEADRDLPDPPPRAGRGSGLSEWQAFADLADVDFADGATRNDIIAACVMAGVIRAE